MINLQNSALLCIEFQNEWLDTNGKLHYLLSDKEPFFTSLKNAKELIQVARETESNIVHSGLSFTKNYSELGKAQHGLRSAIPLNQTFLEHSSGSQFPEPFLPRENEFMVKGRIGASAFAGSNLDSYLRNNDINTLFIMGYALHVCVESTLRAAHDLGYETIIIEDACSAFTEEQKQFFFEHILHHFGSSMKTRDVINLLRGSINDRC